MISGRKYDNDNPLSKRLSECRDILTKADWLAQNPNEIVESTKGLIPSSVRVEISEYESVLDELIRDNKQKEAFALAVRVLDHHAIHSTNNLSVWARLSSPEVKQKIKEINKLKFGPIGELNPARTFSARAVECVRQTRGIRASRSTPG